jgi:hypothetical protein
MDWLTFFNTNAVLIGEHPVPFVVLAVLAAGAGWGAASLLFKQQLSVLRDRVDHWKEQADVWKNRADGEGGHELGLTKTGNGSGKATAPVARLASVPAFVPTVEQDRFIQIFRNMDGHWMSFGELRNIGPVASWQDMAEDVRTLLRHGWLEEHQDNGLMKEGGHRFRLRGAGLAYARKKGYQTADQIKAARGAVDPESN